MTQNRLSRRNKKHYSKGELNRLIDYVLHPLFDHGTTFMMMDTMLHGLVKNNPTVTAKKFTRYTLLKTVEEMLKGH